MTSVETSARTVGFQSGERNVFFHILTACNLSCCHCYINPAQHGTTTLSRQTIVEWLRLFASPTIRSNLILLGGEPTLHPELPELIRAAKTLRYHVTVDSNGFLFHDLLERITPRELDYLSFSLDGPDARVNDAIRGEGVFAVCLDNMRRAVAQGFRVSVIYTVSSLNIEHLHRMPRLLAEVGVKRFFIQVIGLRGKPAAAKPRGYYSGDSGDSGDNAWQVEPAQWLRVVPAVAHEAARLGLHVTFPKVFLEAGEKFECAGRVAENYFIFPNGRVYRCPLCEDYPLNALRIEDDQLQPNQGLTEDQLFTLEIPEGCVMNKLLQPANLDYLPTGAPRHRISCCLLKQEILPRQS